MRWSGPLFSLVPALLVYIAIEKEDSFVRGKTGLPFPSLPMFVQSLLDAKNIMDLGDLVDTMSLSEEWASTNGVYLLDIAYPDAQIPLRSQWERLLRTKQKRMGRKYDPRRYATRYRRHNERDRGKIGWL